MELCHQDLQTNPQRDESTGKTPRKRKIEIPESWELTKDREQLIEEFRSKLNPKEELSLPLSKLPLSRIGRRLRNSNDTLDENMDLP
jgi:hypothetical protein